MGFDYTLEIVGVLSETCVVIIPKLFLQLLEVNGASVSRKRFTVRLFLLHLIVNLFLGRRCQRRIIRSSFITICKMIT